MNRLWLMRHAKAAPVEDGEDFERRLTLKGVRAVREIGAWVAARRLAPDLVLCSTARRTRETVALLLPSLGRAPEVDYENDLYLAGLPALLARLRAAPASCRGLLMVGHNPGLHELATTLLGSGTGAMAQRLAAGMPTATLAGFALDGPWAALDRGAGRLETLVGPKDARDD